MSKDDKKPDNHGEMPISLPALPNGWLWTTVGQLAEYGEQPVLTGPFGSTLGREDFISEGIPLLTIGCLTEGGVTLDKAFFISPDKARQLGRYRVRCGDLLFSRSASVGRAGIVTEAHDGSIINYHLMRLRLDAHILDPRLFIYYVRGSSTVRSYLREVNHGATRDGINTTDLLGMPVAVPPYSTQSRIVTKIDELFSDLDAGVASLERAKAKLKRYRAAVLKAAVEGKLTEEWRAKHPPKETASQLLERILKERRRKWEGDQLAAYAKAGKKPPANWKDKYKEPQSPNATDLPELPDGWCWASIDQVAIKVTDGEHLSPKTHDTGVFLLSAKDVREHGVVFDDPKYVGLADAHHFRQRCDPDKGDILIVSRGATIGRSTVVQSDEIFCLMGSVILLKPSLHIDSHYLVLSLKSVAGQKQLVGLSGSTAQQAIYIRDIRPLALPIAPILEQHQIISEVERRLSLAHESESEIEANLKRSSRLRQSILKRAFEGKLVPQDSNDEPACVLVDTFCRRQDSERR